MRVSIHYRWRCIAPFQSGLPKGWLTSCLSFTERGVRMPRSDIKLHLVDVHGITASAVNASCAIVPFLRTGSSITPWFSGKRAPLPTALQSYWSIYLVSWISRLPTRRKILSTSSLLLLLGWFSNNCKAKLFFPYQWFYIKPQKAYRRYSDGQYYRCNILSSNSSGWRRKPNLFLPFQDGGSGAAEASNMRTRTSESSISNLEVQTYRGETQDWKWRR